MPKTITGSKMHKRNPGVIHSLFMEVRLFIYIGIEKPFVCGMKSVISPPPAWSATAKSISVVSLNGRPDV
jgi:hypothetical protein